MFSSFTLGPQRLRDMKVHTGLLMESWQLSGMECSHSCCFEFSVKNLLLLLSME